MTNYFERSEFECKCGCGRNEISKELIIKLNQARHEAKTPFVITSGYRCPSHNKSIGSLPSSSHPKGLAVDIKAENSNHRMQIIKGLIGSGFSRIGISKKFIHADIDKSKPQQLAWVY